MLISDRDGVLFDTCKANFASYLQASRDLGLPADELQLSNAIHSGDGISSFSKEVWGDLSAIQFKLLSEIKRNYFVKNISNVRINYGFIESFLVNEIGPYLVTKASAVSTYYLLNHFKLDIFFDRVISVSGNSSKLEVFNFLCRTHNLDTSRLKIFDDSPKIVHECIQAGFNAIQYPHFCST
jgi:beta-phosphoglucomutase-like phosphatase (HAD superfamily)